MSVTAFGLGALIALAACLGVLRLRPARPDLGVITARLDRAMAPGGPTSTVALEDRVGRRVVATMTGLGRNYGRLEADLRIADATLAGVVGQSVVLGVAGVFVGGFLIGMLAATGLALRLPLVLGLIAAVAFLCSRAPILATRQRAANRRSSFVHALGALLDFLAIELAAGAGIKDALSRSLDMGDGWAFRIMRERVILARDSGGREWDALEQLGTELGVAELAELGSSIALARTQGATARDTLIAKARALRQRQITAAEAEARKATERAGAPIAIQLYAIMFAIIFVLITRLQTGLGS